MRLSARLHPASIVHNASSMCSNEQMLPFELVSIGAFETRDAAQGFLASNKAFMDEIPESQGSPGDLDTEVAKWQNSVMAPLPTNRS